MTDSQGRVVSFKNTIIIMTSNLGSASVLETLGDKQQARDMVMMSVRSHFRPEFINRIDEFIMFDPLEQDQIKSIVRLQVGARAAGNAWCCLACNLAAGAVLVVHVTQHCKWWPVSGQVTGWPNPYCSWHCKKFYILPASAFFVSTSMPTTSYTTLQLCASQVAQTSVYLSPGL